MLNLPNVTLLTIDTTGDEQKNIETQLAIDICKSKINFGDIKVLTKKEVPEVKDYISWNEFNVYDLNDWVETDFVMSIQQDGFVVNVDSWTDEYFEYDILGAPWVESFGNNDGFSLKSKKLLFELSKLKNKNFFPYVQADKNITHHAKNYLEAQGIKFAPQKLNSKFSYEKNAKYTTYNKSFGIHGKHSPLKNCTNEFCAVCDVKKLGIDLLIKVDQKTEIN